MAFLLFILQLLPTVCAFLFEVNHGHPGQGSGIEFFPRDCQDVLWSGFSENEVYTIYPQGSGQFYVYCDQQTDGGGWTVFQRRNDGTVDFFRNWIDYKYGFGNITDEFWLGNHRIYEIVKQGFYELRIDMEDFNNVRKYMYALYRRFSIGDEHSGYILTVEDYMGNAGDSLSEHSGHRFYTKDKDTSTSNGCAATYKGAWWYVHCHASNLNGLYQNGTHASYADGINWKAWHGFHYSLKFTEMKIRRL